MAEITVFYEGPIVTKKEAEERGLKRFFTGKPCLRGHIAERRVKCRSCVECCKILTALSKRRLGTTTESQIVEDYLSGVSSTAIARKFSINRGTVWYVLKNNGVILRPKRKFTEEEIRERRRKRGREHLKTDKGRKTNRKSALKYARSEKGKSKQRAWKKTPIGIMSIRNAGLKYRYGITQDAWDGLFDAQGRVCAVCGTDDPGCTQGWNTHHTESASGVKVHGILCMSCNRDARDGSKERVAYLRQLADWIEAGL